jgi:hypothetical protein
MTSTQTGQDLGRELRQGYNSDDEGLSAGASIVLRAMQFLL